jgi:hypothetical protein
MNSWVLISVLLHRLRARLAAFGESRRPHRVQHLVGGAQLLARVTAAALAAQPLSVEEVRAGKLRADPGTAQPVDRLEIQPLGAELVAEQRTGPGLDPERPVGGGGAGGRREPPRRILRTGLPFGLGRVQRTASPAGWLGGKVGGTFAERRRGGQASAGVRPVGRPRQLGRDVLVRVRCGVRPMPRSLIGTDIRTGGLREGTVGTVDALALPRRGRPVDRGPGQRMTKPDLPAELDEPDRGFCCPVLDSEVPGRPPYRQRIPGRLGSGDQQQQLRRGRKQGEPPLVHRADQCSVQRT